MAFPAVIQYDVLARGEPFGAPPNLAGLWKKLFGATETGNIASEGYVGPGFVEASVVGAGAYWDLGTPTSVQAISVELHALPSAKRYIQLFACLTNPGTAAISGYRFKLEEEATAGKFKVIVQKIVENVYSNLTTAAAVAFAVGDLVGFSVEGGKVIAWHKAGAGEWAVAAEVADATYASGRVGIGANGSNSKLRKFQCGAIAVPSLAPLTLLDSFIRAAENPLSNGGKWLAQKDAALAKTSGVVLGEAYDSNIAFGTPSANYWDPNEYTNPTVTFEFHNSSSEFRSLQIWTCLTVDGSKNVVTGYKLLFERANLEGKYTVKVFRYTGGEATLVDTRTEVPMGVGWKYRVAVQEGKIILWLKILGEEQWLPIYTLVESTYTSGKVGIGANGNGAPSARNFEVGEAEEPHHHVLTLAQSQTPTVNCVVNRTSSATQGQTSTNIRTVARTLGPIAQAQAATVSIVTTKAHEHILTATANQTTSFSRSVAHAVPIIAQGQTVVVRRTPARTLSTTQGQTATITTVTSGHHYSMLI